MTLPLRRFCSTQAMLGRAIQTGLRLTEKRMSVASAWRVAMATIVPFQTQRRDSPVQRSVTVKSSYMQPAYQGWRFEVRGQGLRDRDGDPELQRDFGWGVRAAESPLREVILWAQQNFGPERMNDVSESRSAEVAHKR